MAKIPVEHMGKVVAVTETLSVDFPDGNRVWKRTKHEFIGWLIGFRVVYNGSYDYEERINHFVPSEGVLCAIVTSNPRSKGFHVPLDSYTISGDDVTPTGQWPDWAKKAERERFAEDPPKRDDKGRFLKDG